MMNGVVKGNRPLRMFGIAVAAVLIIGHFLGHYDLLEPSILWLLLFMSANAIQASFTGFCPMFKNAKGECIACGVTCDDTAKSANDSGCCSGGNCCAEDDKKK